MSSYAILKTKINDGSIEFLMRDAVGTKTFKDNASNAWSAKDHRKACDMMIKCIDKHCDTKHYNYKIDDLDESGDW